jgi:hydroxymethylglutaryl-CoA lyase
MNLPPRVRIVEVGLRDGLQNEEKRVSVSNRINLIRALVPLVSAIEAGSLVSPKWVPQLANTDLVLAGLNAELAFACLFSCLIFTDWMRVDGRVSMIL